MGTILYLIRHGETDWNKERRIQGHSDVQLNAIGLEQADKLAEFLARDRFNKIYSSDLKRAYDTAFRLSQATGSPLEALVRLRERSYGKLEGLSYEEVRERMQQAGDDESLLGIESVDAIQDRAFSCLSELVQNHKDETIAVVSHGGYINSFLYRISNGMMGTGITRLDNTGITKLVYDPTSYTWETIGVNSTPHL
ncbi:UNVERIFIED_CONTAM: putative phosphoglycerate mutase [Brevibacillus sp. OAP136]